MEKSLRISLAITLLIVVLGAIVASVFYLWITGFTKGKVAP